MFLLLRLRGPYCLRFTGLCLTGPKPKGIKVETFRIDCLIRTPKVKKLSLQPIRCFIVVSTLKLKFLHN